MITQTTMNKEYYVVRVLNRSPKSLVEVKQELAKLGFKYSLEELKHYLDSHFPLVESKYTLNYNQSKLLSSFDQVVHFYEGIENLNRKQALSLLLDEDELDYLKISVLLSPGYGEGLANAYYFIAHYNELYLNFVKLKDKIVSLGIDFRTKNFFRNAYMSTTTLKEYLEIDPKIALFYLLPDLEYNLGLLNSLIEVYKVDSPSEKIRIILEMYYGENLSLDKIAEHFSLSKEAIRQTIIRYEDKQRDNYQLKAYLYKNYVKSYYSKAEVEVTLLSFIHSQITDFKYYKELGLVTNDFDYKKLVQKSYLINPDIRLRCLWLAYYREISPGIYLKKWLKINDLLVDIIHKNFTNFRVTKDYLALETLVKTTFGNSFKMPSKNNLYVILSRKKRELI